MITGHPAWQAALSAESKQALWVFDIPSKNYFFSSFWPPSLAVNADLVWPTLKIPRGASQSVDELTGHTSISTMDLEFIDPSGIMKSLASDPSTIGRYCRLRLGFQGLDMNDLTQFVPMHSGRIRAIAREAGGKMTITVEDGITQLNEEAFINGGPQPWSFGNPAPGMPDTVPALLSNNVTISEDNPRYLAGNPVDMLLAAMQNELGYGQLFAPLIVVTNVPGEGSGTGQAGYAINPAWILYDGTPQTLINPNPAVDVPALLNLRESQFPNERWEFILTSSAPGKSWVESELMRIMGLYWITRGDGQLKPKSMKHPATVESVAINQAQTVGIPAIDRWPIINIIRATIPAFADGEGSQTLTFANQKSLNLYRAPYVHPIDAAGLRFGYGATTRLFLLVNRIFNRHAFHTPIYTFTTYFKNIVLELGDFVVLSHPLVLDFQTGVLGLTNVLCEVIDRRPDYANAKITFTVADCRYMSTRPGYFVVADDAAGVPSWPGASPAERQTYMFLTDPFGEQSDGAPGNAIV